MAVPESWRDLFPLEVGTPGAMRRELVALIVSGEKTATAGLMDEFLVDPADFGPYPEPGLQMRLLDDDGRTVGVTSDTRSETYRFADVPWEFADAEGEGFVDIEHWRRAHRGFWERNVAPDLRERLDPAWELTDDTLVVCEWFTFEPLPGGPA
jgi:uncharacterized protein YhfF